MGHLQTTRDLIKYVLPHVRGRVLDYGAGTAKYREFLAPKSAKYVTFDAQKGSEIDRVGSVEAPPFLDGEFDTIVCNQVFEHIPHPWIVAQHMHRLLVPGGTCIVTAPFFCPFHKDPEDYYRYTPDGLSQLFTDAGFTIVERGNYTPLYSTLFQMFEFTFFSLYAQDRSAGRWKQRFLRYGLRFAKFMDRFTKQDIIYGNSYVIAKKI